MLAKMWFRVNAGCVIWAEFWPIRGSLLAYLTLSLPTFFGESACFRLLLSRQGLAIVAQRFNAGYRSPSFTAVPVGTIEEKCRFSRPCRD